MRLARPGEGRATSRFFLTQSNGANTIGGDLKNALPRGEVGHGACAPGSLRDDRRASGQSLKSPQKEDPTNRLSRPTTS